MRKYVFPVLSFYLDFIFLNALVGLIDHLAQIAGKGIDSDITASTSWVATSILVLIIRSINISIGDRLLSYARAERAMGNSARQWPNLLLGTMMVLGGLKEMIRWSQPGNGMPLFLLVEETPFKIALLTVFGAICLIGGTMALRFTPGARLVNAAVLAFTAAGLAVSFHFKRDALVAAQVARRANQGLEQTAEQAERMVAFAPYFLLSFFAVTLWILYLCRERPASSAQREG